jgi:hypothetical protein
MIIVHPTSLSDTLDSAAEALFYQKSIDPLLLNDLAAMLISRQIQSGSNAGHFLPFASESRYQSRLFTGEILRTEFACRNIQLIEAARLLALLAMDHRRQPKLSIYPIGAWIHSAILNFALRENANLSQLLICVT